MNPLDLPDTRFLLLMALRLGERLDADADGRLVLAIGEGGEPVAIPSLPAALDDLEERGWVEITDAGPVVTDRGTYWLNRWLTRKVGRGTVVRAHLRAVRT